MIFRKSSIKISKKTDGYSINAELFGEKIDAKKHELRNDIKAITLHMFSVEKTKEGYTALVVVDV